MPRLSPAIQSAVRTYDRQLAFVWNASYQRWTLVRYTEGGWGRYWEILVVENPDGSFREPDQRVLDYLRMCDLGRFRGRTPAERMKSFLRWKNENNASVKADQRRCGIGDRFARFQDWAVQASRKLSSYDTAACKRLEDFMDSDSERVKELEEMEQMELTKSEKRAMLAGKGR